MYVCMYILCSKLVAWTLKMVNICHDFDQEADL